MHDKMIRVTAASVGVMQSQGNIVYFHSARRMVTYIEPPRVQPCIMCQCLHHQQNTESPRLTHLCVSAVWCLSTHAHVVSLSSPALRTFALRE